MNLRDVLYGNFKAWKGLPSSVILSSIKQQLLPALLITPSEEKVRKYSRAWVTVIKLTDPLIDVEVWEKYDKKNVFLIECDCMLESDVEQKLEELGKPDMVINDKRFFPHSVVKEHVHATRGLCISVANLFSGERKVIHIQLFQPITPETYITEIGSGPDFHPFPL